MKRHGLSSGGVRTGWTLLACFLLGLPTLAQAQSDPPERPEPKAHQRPVDRTPPREATAAPAPASGAVPARPAPEGSTAVRRGGGQDVERPARTPSSVRVREPDSTNRREGASAPAGTAREARTGKTSRDAGVGQQRSRRKPGGGPAAPPAVSVRELLGCRGAAARAPSGPWPRLGLVGRQRLPPLLLELGAVGLGTGLVDVLRPLLVEYLGSVLGTTAARALSMRRPGRCA